MLTSSAVPRKPRLRSGSSVGQTAPHASVIALIRNGCFKLADLIINHWFRLAIVPLLSFRARRAGSSFGRDQAFATQVDEPDDAQIKESDALFQKMGRIAEKIFAYIQAERQEIIV